MGKQKRHNNYHANAERREKNVSRRGGTKSRPNGGDPETALHGWEKHRRDQLNTLPERLPVENGKTLVEVYVEGYEDVSFWRSIFDDFESDTLTFEIGVPPREDLAKGKKVILSMMPECSPTKILCVDSDFDYLFGNDTEQSQAINSSQFIFHTYAYATENFLCYAPSLHNVCVKATKNDRTIFDFERFMTEYSRIIYPLFLWYAFSANLKNENVFTLLEFRSSVKLNYLEIADNGNDTLKWLERQVEKRLVILQRNRPGWESEIADFENKMKKRGLQPEHTYLFMQGHTLLDNVVMIMLNAVCEQLRLISNVRIATSTKTGTALKNEMSNYNNALRNVRDVLLDNESYKECHLYIKLKKDIERYLRTSGFLR